MPPPSVVEQVLDLVATIPAGRVLTYGDVAARLGLASARQVGHVLSTAVGDATVPWHRVVFADGTFAAHLAVEQGDRLRAEGAAVRAGRVQLAACRWTGR